MNFDNRTILVYVAGALALFLLWSVFSYFSPKGRFKRRSKKNNGRIVNRAGRPMVKLSAKTDDAKE